MVGIIDPEEYMDMLGWEMPESAGAELVRAFTPAMCDFGQELRTTNLSVDDIVSFCKTVGYVNELEPSKCNQFSTLAIISRLMITAVLSNGPVLTMTAEPAINVIGNENVVSNGSLTSHDSEVMPADDYDLEDSSAPLVAFEANNILLAATGEEFPFNNQFEPKDATAGYGLFYDVNGGDMFGAIDVDAPFDFDTFINEGFGFNDNSHMDIF